MIARFAIPFFFIMGLVVLPLLLAALCRWIMPRKHWKKGAAASVLLVWALVLYGHFVGYQQLEVHRYDFVSRDLPKAFDGYRIAHFSDAHVGTMTGSRQWLMQRAVDSINALQPDLIVFTGDMQNILPEELQPHVSILRQLKAKDGVVAVLGNHDYAVYQNESPAVKEQNCQKTISHFRAMGFDLLLNEHRIVYRDSDSIVIAGMENWGDRKRMPRKGDVKKTLAGIPQLPSSGEGQGIGAPFIVMLQHDPTAWKKKILPECQAQLTLSGHTHGGQFQLLGWSPAALSYQEWEGWTYQGNRALFVSTGLGALIPFRLGMPGEIAVITLKRDK